ncbi:Crp/Fnr family transcriptional regulator [Curvibacter sp. RS43]|uniref:Crp/Fnr family transcriptional regulator n=1 Tax=Curvibacter microcysteis TaxID=3026419 RepID=UPI0023611F42|nr:Crp/Fnr family transcriptional regulator [Curvibacter sp. RS43]MDD0809281.1 Crp/Fnr family transcriptional regulator [Curvibacter sp. RS43]
MFARDLIGKSKWFSAWSSADIDDFFAKSELRSYKKHDLLYRDYQATELIFLVEGSAWACLQSDQGIVRFGLVRPSIVVGLSQLLGETFSDEPCYEFYLAEDSLALAIPTSALKERLLARPVLWQSVAKAAILYQRHCIKLALLLYAGPTKERLVSALFQFGASVAMRSNSLSTRGVDISQEDLAILIQASRQHVNRALKELEAEGVIALGYKRIEIVNSTELERLALARLMFKPLQG